MNQRLRVEASESKATILKHIDIIPENVSIPWMIALRKIFEQMYVDHPDWLKDALHFRLRVEFGRVNRVDIRTDNVSMNAYLIQLFGDNRQWLPIVNRAHQVPYYTRFGPAAIVALNHTCEFCGDDGHTQVFGGGSVGWWVVQCDKDHDQSEFSTVHSAYMDSNGKLHFEGSYRTKK
ncbi:MAG: hypothetical protein JHC38_06430 [Thiotrichales bacterium]|jgi:hypothetical protein|nr:hypothetical protein [Thiotrichales bacterium]